MITIAKPYLDEAEIEAVTAVLRSGVIAEGPRVAQFEQAFAEYIGVDHAVAVNSGTAALHVALKVSWHRQRRRSDHFTLQFCSYCQFYCLNWCETCFC